MRIYANGNIIFNDLNYIFGEDLEMLAENMLEVKCKERNM